MADGDLVDLMTGKLNAQTAFFQGKLKIKGNMGLAMKLKEIKPPEGGAATKKEGGAPGADSGFKCAPVFGQIKAALDQVDYFALIKSAFTIGRGATGLLGGIKQFSKSGIRFPIPYSHFCFTKPLATSEFTKHSHQEFLAQVSSPLHGSYCSVRFSRIEIFCLSRLEFFLEILTALLYRSPVQKYFWT